MTKAYLVSETLLRQVLDALEGCYEYMHKADYDSSIDRKTQAGIVALRTLLASEPKEPFCFADHYGGENIRDSGVAVMKNAEDFKAYSTKMDRIVPLYTKDDK